MDSIDSLNGALVPVNNQTQAYTSMGFGFPTTATDLIYFIIDNEKNKEIIALDRTPLSPQPILKFKTEHDVHFLPIFAPQSNVIVKVIAFARSNLKILRFRHGDGTMVVLHPDNTFHVHMDTTDPDTLKYITTRITKEEAATSVESASVEPASAEEKEQEKIPIQCYVWEAQYKIMTNGFNCAPM